MAQLQEAKVVVSAKNLDLALIKAAGELATTRTQVSHIIKQEKSGFCGFGRKITIEAWETKAQQKSAAKRNGASRSRKKAKQLDEAQEKEIFSQLQALLLQMMRHAFDIDTTITFKDVIKNHKRYVIFDIQSEPLAQMAQDQPELLEAFEHLLKKTPRNVRHELPFKIFVDACSFRQEREDELYAESQRMLAQVLESSQSMTVDYHSAYDRKVIHMALDKEKRVKTRSIGKGNARKLVISPIQAASRQ